MTKGNFDVSFELWDEESSAHGETDDKGYVIEDCSLSDALDAMGINIDWCGVVTAPSLIYCNAIPPYICAEKFNEGTREEIEEGIDEQRHLHFPPKMKKEAIKRLCKLLGVRDCNI